jgi:hypothetical protein
LAKLLLTGKLINEKLLSKINIPIFSPRRRLYEPEATIPLFQVQDKKSALKKFF